VAESSQTIELTSEIVSSYVANTTVAAADLPNLIGEIHMTLASLQKPLKKKLTPAVPVKNSVKPGYVICLECKNKYKMLKRHIRTAHNLMPEEYRERWNLPSDYPLIAPDYAAKRSMLAKKIGLGTKGGRWKK
jgi:predicted transcriptional regulator